MTTNDTSEEKQDREIDESVERPLWENLPDVDERLKEILQEATVQSRTEAVQQTIMPKIKELETLKEGVYSVDLEKTINDMFMVMKNMEVQLERVLRINSLLEKDLNEAKEMIADLKEAKSQLEQTISRMEMEVPSKRELQIEIDQLIEERNNVQTSIHGMGSKIEKLQGAVIDYQKRSGDLEEEKRDLMSEINFLGSRLNTATEKFAECKNEINALKGEKLAYVEKSKVLEEELNEALDDKYKLMSELKSSKKAMAELHSALSDKKLKAKRSFYESAGG
jgi:chromosome segregation ATPase